MEPAERPQLHRLLGIIARLRAPGGCPWDREQTEVTMAPHLLEEAFEAAEAIARQDRGAAREELGDVLMNVLMIAQISSESGGYDAEQVACGIADKLVRRHPHVFADAQADDPDQVLRNWERIKQEEKSGTGDQKGVLDGLPKSLPALLKAFRVGEKAARVGFDWPDCNGPREKVDEELGELDEAIAGGDRDAVAAELGDLLYAVVNLARHLEVNPEMALRGTIDRFTARFRGVEQRLGPDLHRHSLAELEAAWQAAKAEQRGTEA